MKSLDLSPVDQQWQATDNRNDPPGTFNLEEINMSEQEFISSYDPQNKENNYHLPYVHTAQIEAVQTSVLGNNPRFFVSVQRPDCK